MDIVDCCSKYGQGAGIDDMIETLSGCRPQSNISLSARPISFDTCRSGPVQSRNRSVMTTSVGEDENRELGLWDHLPMRNPSP